MKRLGWILIACVFVAMTPMVSVQAQQLIPLTRAALDSIMHPELLEGGDSILHFEECMQSVGTLLETDGPVTASFHFRHVGNKPTSIQLVRTFCRCTSARYDTLTLQPGDTGCVELVYRPRNHPGTIDEYAYVYTSDSDSHPVARLVLLGEVKEVMQWRHLPQNIGPLHLKRKEIWADVPELGKPRVVRMPCVNGGSQPLRLSAEGLPSYVTFRTEPRVLREGQEGDLVITIGTEGLPDVLPSSFEFQLTGLDESAEERTLYVYIRKE